MIAEHTAGDDRAERRDQKLIASGRSIHELARERQQNAEGTPRGAGRERHETGHRKQDRDEPVGREVHVRNDVGEEAARAEIANDGAEHPREKKNRNRGKHRLRALESATETHG